MNLSMQKIMPTLDREERDLAEHVKSPRRETSQSMIRTLSANPIGNLELESPFSLPLIYVSYVLLSNIASVENHCGCMQACCLISWTKTVGKVDPVRTSESRDLTGGRRDSEKSYVNYLERVLLK